MTLFKSLLLGSAAGLVAIAGASAADLGAKKPSAATFVKECPTYGAGFFVVPGTTSCLKIIGRVRTEYRINNPLTKVDDRNTFLARGYLGYDHRTATEYGLLRTYVRGFLSNANGTNGSTLEYAFIQFGGLTAGRIAPTFDHGYYFNADGHKGIGSFSDISYVNSIGYSQSFGGGFKASLNLDAASERRRGIRNSSDDTTTGVAYNGQSMPDIVGVLDYEQSWGSIKLAGAVHQVNAHITNVGTKNEYGYAAQLAGKYNLTFLNKGSNIWASANYANGASSYTGFTSASFGNPDGTYSFVAADATVNDEGQLKLVTTYGFAGGVQVFVAPTVYVGLAGNYGVYDPSGANNKLTAYTVQGIVGWQPVAGLHLFTEASYVSVTGKTGDGHGQIAERTDKSNWVGRLRIQRDF